MGTMDTFGLPAQSTLEGCAHNTHSQRSVWALRKLCFTLWSAPVQCCQQPSPAFGFHRNGQLASAGMPLLLDVNHRVPADARHQVVAAPAYTHPGLLQRTRSMFLPKPRAAPQPQAASNQRPSSSVECRPLYMGGTGPASRVGPGRFGARRQGSAVAPRALQLRCRASRCLHPPPARPALWLFIRVPSTPTLVGVETVSRAAEPATAGSGDYTEANVLAPFLPARLAVLGAAQRGLSCVQRWCTAYGKG